MYFPSFHTRTYSITDGTHTGRFVPSAGGVKTLPFTSIVFLAGMASNAMAGNIKYDQPPKALVYIQSVQSPNGAHNQPGYPVYCVRGSKLSTYVFEGKRDQLYTFQADRDVWWHIIPQTGGAVTLEGNKNGNGVRLVIWDYDPNAANQKFLVQHQGGGRFKIFSSYGRAVTVANRTSENDSAVQTWDDHSGQWMEWYLVDYLKKERYMPETAQAATPDNTRAKSGILSDALSGSIIEKRYFENITFALFEGDNGKKNFQNWMNGLPRNDQMKAYSDLLDAALRNNDDTAKRSIFNALSEVSPKAGAGFADTLTTNMIKKQYNDAAARQKDSGVRSNLQKIAGKLK